MHKYLKQYKFLRKVSPESNLPQKAKVSEAQCVIESLQLYHGGWDRVEVSSKNIYKYNLDIYAFYFRTIKPEYQDRSPLYIYLSEFPDTKPTISLYQITRELSMLSHLKKFKEKTGMIQYNLRKLKADQVCRLYISIQGMYLPSFPELRKLAKSLSIGTFRASYKNVLAKVGETLGRRIEPSDIPDEKNQIPFKELRKAVSKIRDIKGDKFSLNSKIPTMLQYYNNHKTLITA